jgi:pyrimidine deaminase RibD-like protein
LAVEEVMRLSRKLEAACRDAIKLAKKSESYMERDGKIHPLVGAVILDGEDNQLSRGARREDGTSHAEVVAIRKLRRSDVPRVHTVVTTLEPCCYRNDLNEICCAKQVVRSGAKRVIIGSLDPAASVRGRGAHILQLRKVYFTMFPEALNREVLDVNSNYIRWESELYGSGRKRQRHGIVRDDMELSLEFGPARVRRYLTSREFWSEAESLYDEFKSKGIPEVAFGKFFSLRATFANNRIAHAVEGRLFQLFAGYLAVPQGSTPTETATGRQYVYQTIGEWWLLNMKKNRRSLRAKLCG